MIVNYWCPGCDRSLVGHDHGLAHRSYCSTADRTVTMIRMKATQ